MTEEKINRLIRIMEVFRYIVVAIPIIIVIILWVQPNECKEDVIEEIPEETMVYYCYNENYAEEITIEVKSLSGIVFGSGMTARQTEIQVEETTIDETEPEETTIIVETETHQKPQTPAEEFGITQEEFEFLCLLVTGEAGIENLKGQIAVAAVVLNRVESNIFPNTIHGVIKQKYQFSCVNSKGKVVNRYGHVFSMEDVSDTTIEAVIRALRGEDPTEELLREEAIRLGLDPDKYAEGGALFYYAPSGCGKKALQNRASIQVKVAIQRHVFYKVWD